MKFGTYGSDAIAGAGAWEGVYAPGSYALAGWEIVVDAHVLVLLGIFAGDDARRAAKRLVSVEPEAEALWFIGAYGSTLLSDPSRE